MKEKQKQEFSEYNNFCKQNGLKACRVESVNLYLSLKQEALNF